MNYNNYICKLSFFVLGILSLILFISGLSFCVSDYVLFLDWNIVTLNSCCVTMSMLLDYKCMLFMSFVLFISSLVIYYSNMYMMGDQNLSRFIILVLLFVLTWTLYCCHSWNMQMIIAAFIYSQHIKYNDKTELQN